MRAGRAQTWRAGAVAKSDPAAKLREIESRSRSLHQTELRLSAVTGQPEWDTYLGLVETRRRRLERDIEALRRQIESTDYLAAPKLVELRHKLTVYVAQRDTLDWVIDLPKKAIESLNSK